MCAQSWEGCAGVDWGPVRVSVCVCAHAWAHRWGSGVGVGLWDVWRVGEGTSVCGLRGGQGLGFLMSPSWARPGPRG